MATQLKPLEGLLDLLDWAEGSGIKIALVTNAPRLNADHMLEVLGLAGRFKVEITIEEVERGKPDPLPYLTAIERLGISAGEAIAFEDSPSGMRAAKAAGLFSFGVLTGLTRGRNEGCRRRRRHHDLSGPRALGDPGAPDRPLEHFSAKRIRFAVKKCGKPKKRDDSAQVETALERRRSALRPHRVSAAKPRFRHRRPHRNAAGPPESRPGWRSPTRRGPAQS